MKTNVFLGLGIRIIILFGMGFFMTYANEEMTVFFKDTHDRFGHVLWSARHMWYFWGMFCLFILSAVNAVISAINLVNKNYKL